jgi:hypothetical protein
MRKHFVTFYSPGTFVAETDEKPIAAWDVQEAITMADKISQRYGATPYGFRFSTRGRGPKDLDSRETKASGMYYLGGEVLTLKQVIDRRDPKDDTLISNMKCNKYDRVIQNSNSYLWTQPLAKDDVVLDYVPPKKRKEIENG